MSRPSPSRQSSSSRQSTFSYTSTPSRRSSRVSNPNVFSDDYALEPIDSEFNLSLQDSIQSNHTFIEPDRTRDSLNVTPYPVIPARLSGLIRPNSTSKRTTTNDSASTSHDGAMQRTLSTSSRFSFFRPQSPYSGPTQPSHPYAMYPQVTRASSIASQSTIRPHENTFEPVGGPEHPYSLYAQNTMPEDSGEDIGTQAIPLGFPRLGLNHQASPGTPRTDVGDIIGSDGHVEQLPPYTRYADNVVAKGDMANISDTSTLAISRRPSQRSTLVASVPSIEVMDVDSTEREILLNEDVTKETWKDKAKRRVCGGGVALWVLVVIFVLILFAGIVGGVIGGVVGRRQGKDLAIKQGASLATTTIYSDADPASTNKDTPPCPTGKYTIPLNQTEEINSCVSNGPYGRSWDCLDIAFIGITISDRLDPTSGNKTLQVSFDDYSIDTSRFLYGPQPPDFNGSSFDLNPYKDKDNDDFGVAMFFYKTFDKLNIIPDWVMKDFHRRSISAREIHERNLDYHNVPLRKGDQPWFCFFNETINEFYIYLEKPFQPTTTYSLASMITDAPSPSSASISVETPTTTTQWAEMHGSFAPTVTKRDTYTTPYYPQYPKLIKMVEKRKPDGNIAPYCQKMQVLDNWQIVPNANNMIIPIEELEYTTDPLSVGPGKIKRWNRRRSTTQELESNCVCEWLST